jgi:hypothetical protein
LRRAIRGGGGRRTESAVDAALRWLAAHQAPDGRWSNTGFTAQCKQGRCGGAGKKDYDAGVTGLALLAFLGAGHTSRIGKYKETVRRSAQWLSKIQRADGCIGARNVSFWTYNHMIPALALAEAYGMSREPWIKESAQKAIDFIGRTPTPNGSWGIPYKDGQGQGDTTVTAWAIMALKSAKIAGLRVPMKLYENARVYYAKMMYKEKNPNGDYPLYRCHYSETSRARGQVGRYSTSACAMVALQYMGEDDGCEQLVGMAEFLLRALPRWAPGEHTPPELKQPVQNMYYWYYGTLSMFQMGGHYWTQWNRAMKATLLPNQVKGGCEDGSWPPAFVWGGKYGGGRVYSTAMCALCLEVYYRYLPLYK